MKILIAAPTYITTDLHIDFAQETLDSIKTKHEFDIFLVQNNDRPYTYKGAASVVNDQNNVAGAWNKALEKGKDYDYILIPNLDIVFKHDCIDNLVEFAEKYKEFNKQEVIMWTASENDNLRGLQEAENGTDFAESPHFSCFMVPGNFIELLGKSDPDKENAGKFDESFAPAYFEDLDMHNRIRLADKCALRTTSALFYHYGSRTIHASDNPVEAELTLGSTKTRQYYLSKWGDTDYNKIFKTPFNK